MKTQLIRATIALALCASLHQAAAQGTAFTYQGRLIDGGNPANGSYDLSFSLYTVSGGGSAAYGPLTNSTTAVTNGLFTVTLDFGPNVFSGGAFWLDIAARTNGNGAFTELSPRQPLTASPYSIYSGLAAYATLADGVAGGVIGPNAFQVGAGPTPGQVLSYNGSLLAWTTVGSGGGGGWSLTGNSGTIPGTDLLGTTDNQPLELWVNNGRALRLEPGFGNPNIVGGRGSSVDPAANGAAIGGGVLNTVAGGSGGTIGGGFQNTVSNLYPTVSGGEYNSASANGATVAGGYNNVVTGREATISGGAQNIASADGTFVGGGGYDGTSIGGNSAIFPAATAVGGFGNSSAAYYASIVGGYSNSANGANSFIGGGAINSTFGFASMVPGGLGNTASGAYSFAAGDSAMAVNNGAFVWADASSGSPFSSTANNQFNVRALGGIRLVTGGNGATGLTLDGYEVLTTATGGGGGGGPASNAWNITGNTGANPAAGIFLGTLDTNGLELRVNGGRAMRFDPATRTTLSPLVASFSVNVNGGYADNTILAGVLGGTIAGGGEHVNSASFPNTVTGDFGTVGGGSLNTAGLDATVPGGFDNSATGAGSFAAGRNAHTSYDGNFVWGDGTQTANGTGPNRFEVLATGGVNFYTSGGTMSVDNGRLGINTSTPRQALDVNGGYVEVQGNGAQAYIGGLGTTEVEVGSFNSNVTAVSFVNLSTFAPMHINCSSITIQGGADLAEPFQISASEGGAPQGSVLVIDEENPGHLKLSDRPYDTRVAGVVSGANGINPGIQMQQQGLLEGGQNVALTGRVYVQADASNGPITPGDLLTSSTIPGHAMRVSDHSKAQGAILGKAMTGLKDGKGVVLVLVTLQ